MSCFGNIIWFVFGGFILGVEWVVAGILCCITVVGIPFGMQCFKYAGLAFFPFGKHIELHGGASSFILNIIWICLCGLPIALTSLVTGGIFCLTIVGIPFGLQHFKLAKLAFMPFGATVV